jgi:hypothetical protein
VSQPLAIIATVVAGLLAALGVVSTVARRRMGLLHWIVVGALEAVLLVQAVVALVAASGGGHHLAEPATFYGYLGGILLVPAIGAGWAWSERTRWAGTQLAVTGLAVAIMVWRLVQLWEAPGG